MDLEDWFALFAVATSIYNAGYVQYLRSLIPPAGTRKSTEPGTKKKPEEKQPGTERKKKSACLLNGDIVEYAVLPRLPAKALLRLQCVSRAWRALVSSDPYFVYMQSRRPSSAWLRPMRTAVDQPVGLVSRDKRSVGIPSRFSPRKGCTSATIVASCGGLLCLMCESSYGIRLFIGNPALSDWVLLPFPSHGTTPFPNHSSSWLDRYGLAVDVAPAGVRYNLVLVCRFERDNNGSGFFVFSSTTQQWRLSRERIVLSPYLPVDRMAVYVKGCLYWKYGSSRALWFDPIAERGGLEALPSDTEPDRPRGGHRLPGFERYVGTIGEWNGKLSYGTIKSEEIEIWSMEDRSYWSKIHSISLEKISRGLQKPWGKYTLSLMPLQDDGDAALLWFFLGGAIYSYDMVTEEISKHAKSTESTLFPYKNSLVYSPQSSW